MSKQVVFHGGCFGCTQQELNGVNFCFDCRYFDAKWDKRDLSNQPPDPADIVREQVKRKMNPW